MKIFKYSEAQQKLSTVLDTALKEDVIITRKDGSQFKLVPINKKSKESSFGIGKIDRETIDIIREGREVSDYFKNKY
jgi:antitoxin (DNA-binding transcriptional repressor) of toxin-antitoxin stability system